MGGHPSIFIASVTTRMQRWSCLRPRKGICQGDSPRSHGKAREVMCPLIVMIDASSFRSTIRISIMLRTGIMSSGIRKIMALGLA